RVDLNKDLLLEVFARPQVQVLMVTPRIAIDARVGAAPVRVHRPSEGHVRRLHSVQQPLALHLDRSWTRHWTSNPLCLRVVARRTERTSRRMYVRCLYRITAGRSRQPNARDNTRRAGRDAACPRGRTARGL